MQSIYPLKGVIQHYDWGGFNFIPSLIGKENRQQKPCAELWLGAHPKGVSEIKIDKKWMPLDDFIQKDPRVILGQKSVQYFGESLPFLFKILDVKKMLSIQVHPNKKAAEFGFEKENIAGIPLGVFHRNFRDTNHKPELMYALTDFWLLHGFKSKKNITNVLNTVPEFSILKDIFSDKGSIKHLYQYVMQLTQNQINTILKPLQKRLFLANENGSLKKDNPDFWANRAFQNFTQNKNYDRGIFSIYFLNLVFLKKGESIFQDSGILHAYLEGVNVELMANSDNVLRGGLTPKHIDVPELMKHVNFEAVSPKIIHPTSTSPTTAILKTSAPDFELARIELTSKQKYIRSKRKGSEIYLIMEGTAKGEGLTFKKGESFFAPDDASFELEGNSILFRASINV